MPLAGPQVQPEVGRSGGQTREREQMGFGQVGHVNVVANGGSVGRWVVGAEDLELFAATESGFDREGNEMRFRVVVLADLAVGIGASGVEITERSESNGVGLLVPAEDLLDRELRLAVRIHRHLKLIFGDGDLGWLAVRRAGRREDDVPDAVVDHRIEQRQRVDDVVMKILARMDDRLADVRVRREMNDRRDFVLLDHAIDERAVSEVAFLERAPLDRPLVSVHEVVEHDRLEPRPGHQFGGVTSDVTRAPSDQDRHDDVNPS